MSSKDKDVVILEKLHIWLGELKQLNERAAEAAAVSQEQSAKVGERLELLLVEVGKLQQPGEKDEK